MEGQGSCDARFGPVRECFAEILCAEAGTGAAFAAWCDEEGVVDLWGGYADRGRRRPWEARSLVQPYSVSKPFAAVCALRLVQAGRLDLDAPVQRYWPEFRGRATVRHVLSHQAGVVMLDRQVPTEAFYDWDYLCGPAGGAGTIVGAWDRARRIGAVLRAPGRRAGPQGRRARHKAGSCGKRLRTVRAGLRLRAEPVAAGPGGGPHWPR